MPSLLLSGLRAFAFTAALLAFGALSATPAGAMEMRSDGIHTESWMKSMTFLDLSDDLAEAKDQGKGLVLLFEQPGCGSCKRLHEVNFQEPALVDYLTQNFDFIQINMYGAKQITDFDGEVLSEAKYAEKHLINFSPTTLFIGADAADGAEVFRLPGYFKPYFYQSGFEYVVDQGPQNGVIFPRWLKAKRDRLAAADKMPPG